MKRKKRSGPSNKDDELKIKSDEETPTDSSDKSKLGRRGFLKVGAGAAALTLANPLDTVAQRRPATTLGRARLLGECNDVPFAEPTKVFATTVNGQSVLQYTLNAEPLNWTFACSGQQPQPGLQPVFNGALPGPSLYIVPGTSINLTLNNRLDTMPPFTGDNCPGGHHQTPPKPACFQHTNLHVHGLQVSPCSLDAKHCGPYDIDGKNPPLQCSSDDVLVDIFPGQSNKYCIVLPDMHAPGTNWYHSHLHGASAYQVSGGMAGAIIIQEPPAAQIVRQDLDKVFMLQEVIVNPPPPNFPTFPTVYGSLGGGGGLPPTTVFVNGLCRPTLKMNAGQTMRWRFINTSATPRGLMKLRLVKTTSCSTTVPTSTVNDQVMFLIAIDGLSFYGVNPQPVRYHLMGNGNRADFLINLQPGLYTLVKDGYPLESVLNPASTNYTAASAASTQVLGYIDVQPSGYKDTIPPVIPGTKPAYLNPIWNVDTVRSQPVQFQNPATKTFQIDNAFYDANAPIQVKLNTAEQWTLQNIGFAGSPGGQTNTHPFHVHLNPFQILDIPFDFEVTNADMQKYFPNVRRWNPRDPCGWMFWDTVALPAQIPPGTGPAGQLQIRSRFLIYDGEYVTHCHILVHEDVGMMINVQLIGNGVGPNVPVHTYPPDAAACIARTSRCAGDTKP
jgi:FtsP/CotA-like multicopper oxidase with cupredoxin domain